MVDYDPLRGYLHDHKSLRWSYGGMKGRPTADWQKRVGDPVKALPALLGMGFTGLWVDSYGYANDLAEVGRIDAAIQEVPIRSQNGRFLFYDLRPFKKRLGKSEAELRAIAEDTLKIRPPG
jgi:hypothetical protein